MHMARRPRNPEDERTHLARKRAALIERERLASCMNATKWRELLLGEPRLPLARAKWINEPEPVEAYDRIMTLCGAAWIEWLEFDPIDTDSTGDLAGPTEVGDRTDEVLAALRAVNAPASVEDGRYRVWGYLRPGVAPEWVVPPVR